MVAVAEIDGQQTVRMPETGPRGAGGLPRKMRAQDKAVDSSATGESMSSLRRFVLPVWAHMGWVFPALFAIAVPLCGLPPVPSVIMVCVAALLPPVGCRLADAAHRAGAGTAPLVGLLLLAVPLPMSLFGAGIGLWLHSGPDRAAAAVAAFAMASGIAMVLLANRRHVLLTVQLAGWSGVAIFTASYAEWMLLMLFLPLSLLVDRRQAEALRQAMGGREAQERARRRAEEILRDFEETGQGWFWETDPRARLTYVSPTICDLLADPREPVLGAHINRLFDQGVDAREGERSLAFHLTSRSSFRELAVRAALKGEERWWAISGRPLYDSVGNYLGFRGIGHDLTERRRSQQEASRLAHYDSLTELANRFQMSQTLDRILDAKSPGQRTCAIFLLDLDRFKQVNDTLGHPAGDALLKQVSQRLTRVVGDSGRVGRLGGDEFKVILPGIRERTDLAHLAHRIIESLSQPYSIDGHRVIIGASVGIAVAPDDGHSSDALVRNADLALYAAKDGGRGRFHFYATDLHSAAEEKRQMEQDLRDAIHSGALEMHYQPIVDLRTECVSGFEALMRWNHPTLGEISPTRFVEVAEDTGLIVAMGEWALRTACHDLARWPESVRVAVNVSPHQFASPHLPATITNAIAQAGIAPERLELEITESVFLSDDGSTQAMFAALKRIGVRLALDDFGTGYSSLGYLKKAPFDKIKIDQSFVRGATQPESRNGAIIASITSLAQSLGMETTAEGVETLDELELVRSLGCSHVQGFIYDRPMKSGDVDKRLADGLRMIAAGPRKARPARQAMLRTVALEHAGQIYSGKIRNISQKGALVEGLWNVPEGTVFRIAITPDEIVEAVSRWSQDERMGIEFAVPLEQDGNDQVVIPGDTTVPRSASEDERKSA